MHRTLRYGGQALVFAMLAVAIGYCSSAPRYSRHDPELALLRVSFSHAGERAQPCRRYTQAELEELAPNMRRPADCPRERVPLYVEVEIDESIVYQAELAPSGLASDGSSTAYAAIPVDPGSRNIALRLRDTLRESGFDWLHEETVELAPGQSVLIDFEARTGGFKVL